MDPKRPFVATYLMANFRNGTLYLGVTSDLPTRVLQHKRGRHDGFSKQHGCRMLVWYEEFETIIRAIAREKAIKHWRRDWKLALIEGGNPDWRDRSEGWFPWEEGRYSDE